MAPKGATAIVPLLPGGSSIIRSKISSSCMLVTGGEYLVYVMYRALYADYYL